MVCFVIGWPVLATCPVRWTTERVVSVDDVTFWVVVAAVTVAWELRRGSPGLGRTGRARHRRQRRPHRATDAAGPEPGRGLPHRAGSVAGPGSG